MCLCVCVRVSDAVMASKQTDVTDRHTRAAADVKRDAQVDAGGAAPLDDVVVGAIASSLVVVDDARRGGCC